MTKTIELAPAREEDLATLTEICVRAFHTDIEHGAPEVGGPPGYDSVDHQRSMLNKAEEYVKIMQEGNIIGGFVVYQPKEGTYYLCQLFLDPRSYGQGIGFQAMGLMFARYPLAKVWKTDTPGWNTRTVPFYKKVGFQVTGEDEGLVLFERKV